MALKSGPRILFWHFVSLTTLAACGTNRYYIEADGGVLGRDSSLDVAWVESTVDVSIDVAVDSAVAPDVTDATPDVGMCVVRPAESCSCATLAISCIDECGPSPCLDRGCGTRCAPRGTRCVGAEDCPENGVCANGGFGSVCSNADFESCTDSRECADGFACEYGSCVPHVVACGADMPCPTGFFCAATQEARSLCVKLYRSCVNSAACPQGTSCRDVDGDANSECAPTVGACDRNSDCAASRQVCGFDPGLGANRCMNAGPCGSDFDCADGLACRDTWGDGFRECTVNRGSSCNDSSQCSSDSICASSTGGVRACRRGPAAMLDGGVSDAGAADVGDAVPYRRVCTTNEQLFSLEGMNGEVQWLAAASTQTVAPVADGCLFQNSAQYPSQLSFLHSFAETSELTLEQYALRTSPATRTWWSGTLYWDETRPHPVTGAAGTLMFSFSADEGSLTIAQVNASLQRLSGCLPSFAGGLAWLPRADQLNFADQNRAALSNANVPTVYP